MFDPRLCVDVKRGQSLSPRLWSGPANRFVPAGGLVWPGTCSIPLRVSPAGVGPLVKLPSPVRLADDLSKQVASDTHPRNISVLRHRLGVLRELVLAAHLCLPKPS